MVFAATQADLPDRDHPIKFYSNQTRQDIKLAYIQALKRAGESIYLSVYGITDPQIIGILRHKAGQVPIHLEYDPSASLELKKILPEAVRSIPIKSKGLMHRKIILVDHSQAFLGSANLTPSSLRHHANLVIGLHHPGLAGFLENPSSTTYSFRIQDQSAELFLFPDPKKAGLVRLIEAICHAKSRIDIAMFTLTHPDIIESLLCAKRRGVEIRVAIDAYTARGASKKAVAALEKENVKIFLSQGRELLHHKWALLDNETLILGSANWTKAAFNKNEDFLLFLTPLEKQQMQFLNQLWNVIESESIM